MLEEGKRKDEMDGKYEEEKKWKLHVYDVFVKHILITKIVLTLKIILIWSLQENLLLMKGTITFTNSHAKTM